LGFLAGLIGILILYQYLNFSEASKLLAFVSLIAAFLAAAPQLSWIFTGFLAIILGLTYYFL
jgi:hypothetical protein